MRSRRLEPDTRPDWRDPDMPVWVNDAITSNGGTYTGYVSSEAIQQSANIKLALFADHPDTPSWRNDPLYNAARRRRRF